MSVGLALDDEPAPPHSPDPPRTPAIAALDVLRPFIAAIAPAPDYAALLEHLLAAPGHVLDPRGGKWPRYVTSMVAALGGDPVAGVLAAAAVACVVAAADVVDDLADDEWPADAPTRGRAINATVALGALGHRCIAALAPLLGPERAIDMALLLGESYLRASDGEDADLRLEDTVDVTEEIAFAMTGRKSGTLVALACEIGATVASPSSEVRAAAREFGFHAGVAAQILNDIEGIAPRNGRGGSDLRLRKKTLPVVFALQCARDEGIARILTWYDSDWRAGVAPATGEQESVAQLIRDLGGLAYAGVIADAQRREGYAALRRLVRLSDRPEAGRLRRLIPVMRWHDGQGVAACGATDG